MPSKAALLRKLEMYISDDDVDLSAPEALRMVADRIRDDFAAAQERQINKPTIHLNGTSWQSLFADYVKAAEAITVAIDATSRTAPNGRDWYPQGENKILCAMSEHRARLVRLESVRSEIEELADHVRQSRRT